MLYRLFMATDSDALKARTKAFALAVLALAREAPSDAQSRHVHQQLVRSATSVGANYRSALRSRSRAEFVSRIGVVLEEADESAFWLELLAELPPDHPFQSTARREQKARLLDEANQLTAIFAATRISAGQNRER